MQYTGGCRLKLRMCSDSSFRRSHLGVSLSNNMSKTADMHSQVGNLSSFDDILALMNRLYVDVYISVEIR
jgi:hypothetical protein